ncbi:MAG TPA: hypothetical protein DCL95_21910, partial [Rhodospirillaceae bacterium]|nr:hypothetical protein [Rhodospirillaceae bacterium]
DEDGAAPYKPIPPDMLYFTQHGWGERLGLAQVFTFNPYPKPDTGQEATLDAAGIRVPDFAVARKSP